MRNELRKKTSMVVMGISVLVSLVLLAYSQQTSAQTKPSRPSKSAPTSAPSTGTYTLRFNWMTVPGSTDQGCWPWKPGGPWEELINRYSKGRLKIKNTENLFGIGDSLLAVADGRVDMGTQLPAFVFGTYPLINWGGLTGLVTDGAATGREYVKAMYDPRMKAVMEKYTRPKGFIILGGSTSLPGGTIFGHKELRTLDGFKGQKIRGGGVMPSKEIVAVMANAVSMGSAEVEEALMRGAVDGIMTTLSFGMNHRLFNLSKYINVWPFSSQSMPTLMAINTRAYDALPPDMQNAIRLATEEMTWRLSDITEQITYIFKAWAEASPAKLVYPEIAEIDKAIDLEQPVFQFWINQSGQYAPEVIRIACDHATGRARNKLLQMVK